MKKYLIKLVKPIIKRSPKLTMMYRYMRDYRQTVEEPQETRLGFKLAGNKLMKDGSFEPEETRIVSQIVKDVDAVINVGANIGYYCCIALSNEKQVVAFEPMSSNLRYLLLNIKANKWESRIEVYPMALADEVGIIKIYGEGTGASLIRGWAGSSEDDFVLVPCSTLDNVLGARFEGKKCLIIVDIEGAEHLMLQGASSIINMNPKPIWMMEISVTEHQPKGIRINPHLLTSFQFFWENGYEALTADKQSRLIYPAEVKAIVNGGMDTLGIHNFLFVEKDRVSKVADAIKS
jgi:FkbM family methyltransferase